MTRNHVFAYIMVLVNISQVCLTLPYCGDNASRWDSGIAASNLTCDMHDWCRLAWPDCRLWHRPASWSRVPCLQQPAIALGREPH